MSDSDTTIYNPLLSVVVPCLNRGDYIGQTLQSILSQSYSSIEIIVMDGGSTDHTLDVIQSFQDDRLQVFSEPDNGQADAVNQGFQRCTGDYCTWLNADDLWKPGAARAAVLWLQTHPNVGLVYGRATNIKPDGTEDGEAYFRSWNFARTILECDHSIPQPASFMRRSALEAAGGIDPTYTLFDMELWPRIAMVADIVSLPDKIWAGRHSLSEHSRLAFARDCPRMTRERFQTLFLPDELQCQYPLALCNANIRASWYARSCKTCPSFWVGWYLFRAWLADRTQKNRVVNEWKLYKKWRQLR